MLCIISINAPTPRKLGLLSENFTIRHRVASERSIIMQVIATALFHDVMRWYNVDSETNYQLTRRLSLCSLTYTVPEGGRKYTKCLTQYWIQYTTVANLQGRCAHRYNGIMVA